MEKFPHFWLLFFLMIFSCTDGSEKNIAASAEAGPPISESPETKIATKNTALNICDCFDQGVDRECIAARISKSKKSLDKEEIARLLMDSDCYRESVAEVEAGKLCDCINRFGQAGLKCDDLQRRFDKTYSETEQMAIAAAFKKLDCLSTH